MQNPRLGKCLLQPVLKALGAAAKGMNILIATGWAGFRDAMLQTAMMTTQQAISQVQHHVGGATRTARNPATGHARQHRRVTTTIEENQTLLAARQALLDGRNQGFANALLSAIFRVSSTLTTGNDASGLARSFKFSKA